MSVDTPLISVGISTYNRKDYLRENLLSLKQQYFRDFEVIVVDDGSSDETGKMVATEFPTVRYFYKENGGDASAKNYAVSKAKGNYVVFLDSDDLFLPDSLSRLAEATEKHPNACIYGWYDRIDEHGMRSVAPPKISPLPRGRILAALIEHICVTCCGVLVPRNALAEQLWFNSKYCVGHDYAWALELATKYNFFPLAEPVFLRRRHSSNLSAANWEKMQCMKTVMEEFCKKYSTEPEMTSRRIGKRLAALDLKIAREAKKEGKARDIVRMALRNSLRNHFSLKAFFRYLLA